MVPLTRPVFFICIKIHNLYEKDKVEEANVVYSLETTGPQLPCGKGTLIWTTVGTCFKCYEDRGDALCQHVRQ